MTRYVGFDDTTGMVERIWDSTATPSESGFTVAASPSVTRESTYLATPGTVGSATARIDWPLAGGTPAADKGVIAADGADTLTISGLHNPSDLLIHNPDGTTDLVTVSATSYGFTATDPGTYRIELARAYKGYEATVVALEAASGAVMFTTADGWSWACRTADWTRTGSTAWTDITGLAFTPEAGGVYEIEARLLCRTNTAADGPGVGVALPTTYDDSVFEIAGPSTGVITTGVRFVGDPAVSTGMQSGAVDSANLSYPYRVSGTLVAGASPSGDWKLQGRVDVAGSTVTVKKYSWLRWRRLPV